MPDNYETPVENVAPDMSAADAQEAVEEVVITAEPSQDSATGSASTVEAAPAASKTPADGAQQPSQKDIDAAFGKRLAQVRRQYESSGEYALGAMILDERAQRDGISREEAYKRIQQERLDERADTYAKNPKEFYKDYLQGNAPQRQPSFQAPQPTEDPQAQARRVGEELANMYKAGALPDGFDIRSSLDQDTYNNIVDYGAPAAMRIWAAEHGPEREIARRQSGPAPMRPTSGASQQSTPTDFSKMTSEEFWKKRDEIKKAMLDGKKVRFS